MIRLIQVSVDVGRTRLLHDLSLDFDPRRLCMIVGPNGAGKTTLLHAIGGDIPPNQGRIEFNGQPLADWSIRELALARAILPQYSSLDFPFSALDVVLMGRLPHTTNRQVNLNIAEEMLHLCDCAHLAERIFPTLSGGSSNEYRPPGYWPKSGGNPRQAIDSYCWTSQSPHWISVISTDCWNCFED